MINAIYLDFTVYACKCFYHTELHVVLCYLNCRRLICEEGQDYKRSQATCKATFCRFALSLLALLFETEGGKTTKALLPSAANRSRTGPGLFGTTAKAKNSDVTLNKQLLCDYNMADFSVISKLHSHTFVLLFRFCNYKIPCSERFLTFLILWSKITFTIKFIKCERYVYSKCKFIVDIIKPRLTKLNFKHA